MTASLTDETESLFAVLRQSADGNGRRDRTLVAEAPDRALCRINAVDFAARAHLDEEPVVAAFLHAARLGLFEMSWNVLCPGCGGVLDAGATLKSVDRAEYLARCAPPATSRPSTRWSRSRSRSAAGSAASPAHEPDELPFFEYMRQMFWCSGVDLPGRSGTARPGTDARHGGTAAGREGAAVAAAAGGVPDRVRAGHPCRAVHRREGRADPRTAKPRRRLQRPDGADRHRRDAPRPAAPVARKPHRPARCRGSGSPETRCIDCWRGAGRS